MQELQIFGFPGSTYVRTARMVCEEKSVRYRLVPLEFGADSHRALHPFLRMPVLQSGERRLYETLAIAAYIDRTCEGPALQPTDADAHSDMLRWISVCNDYLYNDVVRMMVKSQTPSADELAAAKRSLAALDAGLSGRKFLAGANLSLADLFLAPIIDFAMQSKSTDSPIGSLTSLRQWYDRMAMRPSFKATAP